MSNPLLVDGEDLPNFNGDSTAYRIFVSNVSFNDSALQILNAEDANFSDALMGQTLFVSSIRQSEKNESVEKAIKYTPPFIDKEIYTKDKIGLIYSGSFSILNNGVMIPAPLIPNKPELVNNMMQWTVGIPGTSGSFAQTAPWVWRAREIQKEKSENSSTAKTKYLSYLSPANFDTTKETAANKMWARTAVGKKGSQIEALTYPGILTDGGISFELKTSDLIKLKKLGENEYAGDDSATYFDNNGTFKGASLGSFMLLLNLKQDEIKSGVEISKTKPWEVTIRMGEAVDAASNLEDASHIQIKLSQGNPVHVSVYGQRTTFNLPAPPVATATQATGSQDPNTIAISVVPVLNGILISVGNFNGLDKKVSNRMSQFCIANPNLNVSGLYNRTVNVNYPDGEPSGLPSDLISLDDDEVPAPSIMIESHSEDENPAQHGLVPIGDLLSVDLFNVTGKIAYVPLFFTTRSELSLVEPVGSDTSTDNINDINYYYWPVWCKNGMNANLALSAAEKVTITSSDIYSSIVRYQRNSEGLITLTLTSSGLFAAGDKVIVSGLSSGNGTFTLTLANNNTVQYETSASGSPIDESVSNAKIELDDEATPRTGELMKFKIQARCGGRTSYSDLEDNDNPKIRYDAIVGRLNECCYPRYPYLIYGAIKVQKETIDLTKIKNKNTPMFNLGNEWMTCIKNVQVTHAIEGTTGSMTLDRYALNQVYGNASDFGIQQIGQVDFDIKMTKSGVDTVGTKTYAFRLGRDNDQATSGVLFRGFAYGFGIDQNVSSHEIRVPLFGINKKLQEMKLYNAPFFDGETIEKTINFLCGWSNVCPIYSYTNTDEKLSSSSVVGQVLHEFKMGTSIWDAMQEVADDTANYIIVQPDGKVYIYKINDYGEPEHKNFTPKNWQYPAARVIGLTRNPDFSQFYNKIIVMALQSSAAQTAGSNDNYNPLDSNSGNNELPTFPIAVGANIETIPEIPWEKLIVRPLDSFWTESALQKYAKVLAKQAISIYYTGNTTIPGNLGVHLWDKFNDNYWITNINHNYDATTKTLTTDLGLATLKPSGDLTEDINGNLVITAPTGAIEPYEP